MKKWELLVTLYPTIPCYNMRPEDALDLPFPMFKRLSELQEKRIEEWNRSNS